MLQNPRYIYPDTAERSLVPYLAHSDAAEQELQIRLSMFLHYCSHVYLVRGVGAVSHIGRGRRPEPREL